MKSATAATVKPTRTRNAVHRAPAPQAAPKLDPLDICMWDLSPEEKIITETTKRFSARYPELVNFPPPAVSPVRA